MLDTRNLLMTKEIIAAIDLREFGLLLVRHFKVTSSTAAIMNQTMSSQRLVLPHLFEQRAGSVSASHFRFTQILKGSLMHLNTI